MNLALSVIFSDCAKLLKEWEITSLKRGDNIEEIQQSQRKLWAKSIEILILFDQEGILDKKGKTLLRTLQKLKGEDDV